MAQLNCVLCPFNLENLNLLANSNINLKIGVASKKKCVCSAQNKDKENKNKTVNESKTVENIKYEPILSWSSGFHL